MRPLPRATSCTEGDGQRRGRHPDAPAAEALPHAGPKLAIGLRWHIKQCRQDLLLLEAIVQVLRAIGNSPTVSSPGSPSKTAASGGGYADIANKMLSKLSGNEARRESPKAKRLTAHLGSGSQEGEASAGNAKRSQTGSGASENECLVVSGESAQIRSPIADKKSRRSVEGKRSDFCSNGNEDEDDVPTILPPASDDGDDDDDDDAVKPADDESDPANDDEDDENGIDDSDSDSDDGATSPDRPPAASLIEAKADAEAALPAVAASNAVAEARESANAHSARFDDHSCMPFQPGLAPLARAKFVAELPPLICDNPTSPEYTTSSAERLDPGTALAIAMHEQTDLAKRRLVYDWLIAGGQGEGRARSSCSPAKPYVCGFICPCKIQGPFC